MCRTHHAPALLSDSFKKLALLPGYKKSFLSLLPQIGRMIDCGTDLLQRRPLGIQRRLPLQQVFDRQALPGLLSIGLSIRLKLDLHGAILLFTVSKRLYDM
jgi:hypothetical protein